MKGEHASPFVRLLQSHRPGLLPHRRLSTPCPTVRPHAILAGTVLPIAAFRVDHRSSR